MANELQAYTTSGLTLYAVLLDGVGRAWNGSGFAAISGANWGDYDLPMTEATAGIYLADMPLVDAGTYSYLVYEQAGASAAITDELRGSGSLAWDGDSEVVPSSEVVSLADAKLHLRVDGTSEDTLIEALIVTAQAEIEHDTGCKLLAQTVVEWRDEWPACGVLQLRDAPVQSVATVRYYDTANTEATLDSGTYFVDTVSAPARLALNSGQSWPATSLRPINGVCVTYVAGWLTAAAVPAKLVLAVKLLVAWLYENRGDGNAQSPETWPRAITWLCDQYRVRRGFA